MANITRLSDREKKDGYFSPAFLNELENHIPIMLKRGEFNSVLLSATEGANFAGDFNGLLTSRSIPSIFHYPTMRANGLLSPADFTGKDLQLIIPSTTEITRLFRLWRVQRAKG